MTISPSILAMPISCAPDLFPSDPAVGTTGRGKGPRPTSLRHARARTGTGVQGRAIAARHASDAPARRISVRRGPVPVDGTPHLRHHVSAEGGRNPQLSALVLSTARQARRGLAQRQNRGSTRWRLACNGVPVVLGKFWPDIPA